MLQRRLVQVLARQARSQSQTPIVRSNKYKPVPYTLKKGETYEWCRCGQSGTQPLCDGSHHQSGFAPLKFTAEKTEEALLCSCKNTRTPPYCDDTHLKILDGKYLEVCSSEATSIDAPIVAAKLSSYQNLEKDKTYLWCSCGTSKSQPFCDIDTCGEMKPLAFTPEKDESRWLCQCKHTKQPPYCDETHLEEKIKNAVEGKPLKY